MGPAPKSQAIPRDPRPPTALKLGSKDAQLGGTYTFDVLWRSVPCKTRIHDGGDLLCAKTDPALTTALLAGFCTMKENPVLISEFQTVIVGEESLER